LGPGSLVRACRHPSKAALVTGRYAELNSRGAKGQAAMLDASNIPSLIVGLNVGALAAYDWGSNRTGAATAESV
jgi:hypothetical protein